MKPFTKIAATIFGLGVMVHVYRLIFQFEVMIGNYKIPIMASIFFIIIGLVMSIGLWRESNK